MSNFAKRTKRELAYDAAHQPKAVIKSALTIELEAQPERWFKHYMPQYHTHEPAGFHKESTENVLHNRRWCEVRLWSRDLAASTRTMMEIIYLLCTKRKKQVLIISSTMKEAEKEAQKYRNQLLTNARLVEDYQTNQIHPYAVFSLGEQQMLTGIDIVADIVVFMDCDTPENCQGPAMVERRWDWVNRWILFGDKADKNLLVIWYGIAYASDCLINRAGEKADEVDVRNILELDGNCTWPERHTKEKISQLLSTISYNTAMVEYFNKYVFE